MIPYRIVKRGLDVVGAAGALVLTFPVLTTTAILVRKNLGSPILFVQERPGLHGKTFRLLKFRTMVDVDHAAGCVTDEDRLTDFGRWLRSVSLDELPSLVNVLKGDMSFVGPRPLLVRYLERYTPYQARRHEVRPGITGLAQIHGRNALDWDSRFEMDVDYVNRQSFGLDLWILWRTVETVWKRTGIHAEGQATVEEFTGSR